MKLLIVEDDLLLRRGLERALIQEDYVVDSAETVKEAIAFLTVENSHYSAVLLDLGLPDGDGLTLLSYLRQAENSVPVLIITARDTVDDRVMGLDAGADDYLLKPFAIAELYARLRAIIRRHCGVANNQLEIADFALDLNQKEIHLKGKLLELTVREYLILSRLLLKYGQVVAREFLQQDLYSWQDQLGSNTLEVYIHRLRQKIGKERIETVRGFGYQLIDEIDQTQQHQNVSK